MLAKFGMLRSQIVFSEIGEALFEVGFSGGGAGAGDSLAFLRHRGYNNTERDEVGEEQRTDPCPTMTSCSSAITIATS